MNFFPGVGTPKAGTTNCISDAFVDVTRGLENPQINIRRPNEHNRRERNWQRRPTVG